MPDVSPDLMVAEGAIYFRRRPDPARRAAVVRKLQSSPEVGAIFTAPKAAGVSEGIEPGTLSFDVARWNHPSRAGDILVSANWTARQNAAGFSGTTTASGTAGHGSSSPYDIHNTLIAAGPSFRERTVSDVPTGNVDIAPTVLRILGVAVPNAIKGRVIEEGFREGPAPAAIRVEQSVATVRTSDGAYTLTAHLSTAAGRTYLDRTDVARK
jgi:hypothetical protein